MVCSLENKQQASGKATPFLTLMEKMRRQRGKESPRTRHQASDSPNK